MKSHDLTVGSVKKLIASIAIPSMVGSIFMTMYNVVDTIWAGRVGINVGEIFAMHQGDFLGAVQAFFAATGDSRALTALSITFPVFLIVLALSIGAMSGTLALIGNALGKKDNEEATTYLIQAFLYAVIASLIIFVIIPIFPYVMDLMKVEDPVVRVYARKYMNTIVYGGIFFSASMVANAGLISRGNSRTQRNVSIISFFLNIVLDPLFMLGFGPIPAMGVSGIALATIVSQAFAFTVYMIKLHQYNTFEGMTLQCWNPQLKVLRIIAKQSIPQTINMGIIAFLLGFVNTYALKFGGPAAAAAYGVSLRIEQIALIPSMGVSTALSSIASQNNGAKKIERIRETYRVSLGLAFILLMLLMFPLGRLIPAQVLRVFTSDEEVIRIGVSYLKVCFFTFYAYMLFRFSGSVFQSIKKPYWMTILTIGRNCLFPIISFPVLSNIWGLEGVWYAILLNNWVAAGIAFVFYIVLLRKRDREIAGGKMDNKSKN